MEESFISIFECIIISVCYNKGHDSELIVGLEAGHELMYSLEDDSDRIC